jgi:hypothetical protein
VHLAWNLHHASVQPASDLPPPPPTAPLQRVVKIRRDYNNGVASETLEDYALRFTPQRFRKWSEWRVAMNATGAAYPAVSSSDFLSATMLKPSKVLLKAFDEFVMPLLAQQEALKQQLKVLTEQGFTPELG